MTDKTIQERIRRAQDEEIVFDVQSMDPLVVHAHNNESDRVHTITVDALHCSCEDHVYRDTLDKHIIALAMEHGFAGDAMRGALRARLDELDEEVEELQGLLDGALAEKGRIDEVFGAINAQSDRGSTDPDMPLDSTDVPDTEARAEEIVEEVIEEDQDEELRDIEDLVAEIEEENGHDNDFQFRQINQDGFESMVNDITEDEK